MEEKDFWFNPQKTFTYNSFLNFILGSRGTGKTYGFKKEFIKKFIKKGEQFIYLRRYQTELDKAKKDNKFLKDLIKNNEFPNNNLYIKGDTLYCDDKECAYFIPLSKQLIYKSVPFPNVKYILFDEFLIETGSYHYLRNEINQLLELIESVGRMRDIQVFLLANSISRTNIYFEYFNITMPYNTDFKTFKNGLILIQYIHNEKYQKEKANTKFGKLIKGTVYGDYAIENKFLKDNNNFIKKKGKKSQFFFHISINNKIYGVWEDDSRNQYISKDIMPTKNLYITFDFNSHNEKTLLLKAKSVYFQNLYLHYERGQLYFENQLIKNEILNLIHKLKR